MTAILVPGYLVYLAGASLFGALVSACSSKDEDNGVIPEPSAQAKPSAGPIPPKPEPILLIDKSSPDYKIYQALRDAGFSNAEMDLTNVIWKPEPSKSQNFHKPDPFQSPDPFQYKKSPDGQIFINDLQDVTNYAMVSRQIRANIDRTINQVSDEYIPADFSQGDPSRFCQNDVTFQKALFWNPKNYAANYILGNCYSEPLRLFRVIESQPDFQPAKVALENYYRKALKKSPKDPYVHLNLGYALKVQEKYDEAISSYQEAYRLKSEPREAPLEEIRDIYLRQGEKTKALAQAKMIRKIIGEPKPEPFLDDGVERRWASKVEPASEPELEFLPLRDTPFERPLPTPKDKTWVGPNPFAE